MIALCSQCGRVLLNNEEGKCEKCGNKRRTKKIKTARKEKIDFQKGV